MGQRSDVALAGNSFGELGWEHLILNLSKKDEAEAEGPTEVQPLPGCFVLAPIMSASTRYIVLKVC